MKALVVNALGSGFELEDIDIATPIGREVLIDVQASGLCHTDLLFATHDIVPIPAVLGHEVSGIVAEVGPDVTQFRTGDHVVVLYGCAAATLPRCAIKKYPARLWSGRRGSNPRPRPWQGRALPLSYTRIRDGGDRAPSTADV